MSWSFNPFTGNLDIVGGGAVVFEGEVETFADLSETIGDPAVGASFLVRSSTGVWLVNRRQAGIWIRRNNTGVRATDWEYGGDYPVNSVNGQTGNVSLTASSVGAAAATHASTHHTGGTDAIAPNQISAAWAQALSTQAIFGDTVLSAGRNRRIGVGSVSTITANITLPFSGNQAGDTITLVGVGIGPPFSSTYTIRLAGVFDGGGNPVAYTTLATINALGQSVTFVSDGTTTGWSLRAVDTHTHAASQITGAFTTLAANNGTLTASAPVLDLAQTWNNAAVTFRGLLFNVTNTASAAASLLADLQVGGTSQFNINRAGEVVANRFEVPNALFMYSVSANRGGIGRFGTLSLFFAPDTVALNTNNHTNGFGLGPPSAPDVYINRDATDILAQRRGSNGQTFRLYSTFTSTTSFERLNLIAQSAGSVIIGTEKGSAGGTARALEFQTDGTTRLTLLTNGGALFAAGIQSQTGNLQVSQGALIFWQGRGVMGSAADGTIYLQNQAGTDFNRLQFGGTTSSFPALKRSSTTLQVRLADDSAFAPLMASNLGAIRFNATDNQPPSTAFATMDTRNSIAVLDFDDATDESAVFVSIAPESAPLGSGLIVRLHWMATTATSGNVRWGVQFERSNTDLDADSFDTAVEANGAANGTSGILTTTAITVTTIDGITAGDVFRLKVFRNADDATNDTMTGDAELVAVEVRSAA